MPCAAQDMVTSPWGPAHCRQQTPSRTLSWLLLPKAHKYRLDSYSRPPFCCMTYPLSPSVHGSLPALNKGSLFLNQGRGFFQGPLYFILQEKRAPTK